jgi:hypothetical protein
MHSGDVVGRAYSALTIPIEYRLGAGGRRPNDPSPADDQGRCDCSGFACWTLRMDRLQRVDGKDVWLSTGGMVADATGPRRWFEVIDRPEPGCLVVYRANPLVARVTGHVAVVVSARVAEWNPKDPACWKAVQIIHCHGPKGIVPAVTRSDASRFGKLWGASRGTMLLRFRALEPTV